MEWIIAGGVVGYLFCGVTVAVLGGSQWRDDAERAMAVATWPLLIVAGILMALGTVADSLYRRLRRWLP